MAPQRKIETIIEQLERDQGKTRLLSNSDQPLESVSREKGQSKVIKKKVEMILDLLEIDPLANIAAECKHYGFHRRTFYQYCYHYPKSLGKRWSAIKERRGCSAQADRNWRAYQERKAQE